MLYFDCDYNCGMHPAILRRLEETNGEYTGTYGLDCFSEGAKQRIQDACGDPEADIFFLAGGTQANAVVIDSLLKPWQGVVCAPSGHINVHEAGAVEYTGRKVMALPDHEDGKIRPEELQDFLQKFSDDGSRDHMVEPGLVYISFPTEMGTLYSAKEISAIHDVCKEYGCKLFIDGARLGYGLGAEVNDISLGFLADHCDSFYIGGTKVGAQFGEAVVFPHHGAPDHFFTIIKQHGALLAKGRFTALQFDVLFTDCLYEDIGRRADTFALQLRELFVRYGIGRPAVLSHTNQQFLILENGMIAKLRGLVKFEVWSATDEGHSLCRFVTSWATTQDDIDCLEDICKSVSGN